MKKLFILFSAVVLFGCKKEESEPLRVVNYHCYSENSANFKYVDANDNWRYIVINGNYDISVKMKPENMHWVTSITSNGIDSTFISAECNGKLQKESFRSKSGAISLKISLHEIL
jgi:hypothetical protein